MLLNLNHMKDLSLNEIVNQYPGSRHVFETFRFDYCCGGKQTLEHACSKRSIPVEEVVAAIAKRADQKDDIIDFTHWPLDLLIDYIEKKHHRYVVENLELITQKIERLIHRHGPENPYLLDLQRMFHETAVNLSQHMKKEELILFPHIRKLVACEMNLMPYEPAGFGSVENPIAIMETEHSSEGERFESIAELTNNYTPPAHACATWQFTYEKLSEFEKDLHRHIHLENNLLFPHAILLEAQLKANAQAGIAIPQA